MPTVTTSSNMLLPVPIVGADLGPQYAVDINSCLALVDSHDHSTGKGVAITQAGFNVTGDLAFNGFNATTLRTTRFSSQGAVLSLGTDLRCAYVVSNDLYFNDGLGNQIRLTQSGGVAGTPGSITGLVAPASATYIPASSKFTWQSASLISADMDVGAVIIREKIASANGVTIASPSSLAANYSVSLFTALPAIKKLVSIDNAGTLKADQDIFPTGSVIDFAGSSNPTGWLLCFGQAVSRTTYSDLFALISTTYGVGDGSTTFNLPDLRGRTIAGKDDMGGSAASRITAGGSGITGTTLGAAGGVQTHPLVTGELASHLHTASSSGASVDHSHVTPNHQHRHVLTTGSQASIFGTGGNITMNYFSVGASGSTPAHLTENSGSGTTGGVSADHSHSISVNTAGSGTAHQNTQPTFILNKIIKT